MSKPKVKRVPIVRAADLTKCEHCGEPVCLLHGLHFADCSCIGPDNAADFGLVVVEDKDGRLWGASKS